MNKYYAYTRVSTQRQGEKGVSLQEQHAAIARYAERFNLQIAEWFEERVTAAKSGRPIFGRMVQALHAGKAKGVIIHKIDRGARNLRDWSDLGDLIDAGVAVHFANESIDLQSRGGRLSADIQAVVASDYVRNLREETIKGMYGRLKQGLYPWGAPVGYLNTGGGKVKEIDPVKGPLVRRAFEMYASGRFGLDSLAEELQRIGLTKPNSRPLAVSTVSFILNNPFYMGIIKVKSRGTTYPGKHTPLISAALFRLVQDRLSGKTQRRIRVHDFLLRGLFTCEICGRYLVGELQKGHTYYRCHTAQCATKTVRQECMEAAVIASWPTVQLTEEHRARLLAHLERAGLDDSEAEDARRSNLTAQLAATDDRLSRLIDAFVDGAVDKASFEHRKQHLLEDRMSIEEQLKAGQIEPGQVRRHLVETLELVCGAEQSYRIADTEQKRELIIRLSSNRSVREKCVRVEPYFPLVKDLKALLFQCGAPGWIRTNGSRS